jgi:hypothetical protein
VLLKESKERFAGVLSEEAQPPANKKVKMVKGKQQRMTNIPNESYLRDKHKGTLQNIPLDV